MHDPEVVVFEIKRPWPQRRHKSGWRYWPPLVTVWHVEPNGGDALSLCKGMTGSGWSWANLRFAVRHIRHLEVHVLLYRRVKRWLFDHCGECGYRFLWKSDRVGYMSSDTTYHGSCMALRHARMQLEDLTAYIRGTADQNQRWRATYRLDQMLDQMFEETTGA